MPKFINDSGKVYSSKNCNDDQDDEAAYLAHTHQRHQKPKLSGPKPKSNLELFKEELKRLQEERDENNKRKNKNPNYPQTNSNESHDASHPTPPQLALKPDPRCPTNLTLQVKPSRVDLAPVVDESRTHHSNNATSLDSKDLTSTNIYVGNLNPTVNETELCDIFGKFGSLASIKVMWPRSDEEKARNRNCGFVAYMCREDAYRAMKTLNGKCIKNYNLKLVTNLVDHEICRFYQGWGKAIPIPLTPVFISSTSQQPLTPQVSIISPPKKIEKQTQQQYVDSSRSYLDETKKLQLADTLEHLEPTRKKVGSAMLFCITNANVSKQIIQQIEESTRHSSTIKSLAKLYLISDILHNCYAPVLNASSYREGFRLTLTKIFENFRELLTNSYFKEPHKCEHFKYKVFFVLSAWKEWAIFEDSFMLNLSNILLGSKSAEQDTSIPDNSIGITSIQDDKSQSPPSTKLQINPDKSIDGDEISDDVLTRCLEAKGLSLRWYKTLELSEDEEDDNKQGDLEPKLSPETTNTSAVKFKSSKWEVIDPAEVAEQVVTKSKWEKLAEEQASFELASKRQSELSMSSLGSCESLKRRKVD